MGFLLTIFGGGLIQFFIGGLWYGPIAGAVWLKLSFVDGKPPSDQNQPLCHVMTVVANVGLNAMLKLFLDAIQIQTLNQAIALAMCTWSFGFFMHLPHVLYGHKSLMLMAIDEIYHVLALLVLMVYHAYVNGIGQK